MATFRVRINGSSLIEGDESSIAVIYNNLAGLNSTAEDYTWYLRYMAEMWCSGIPLKNGDSLEYLVNDRVLASCHIGDRHPDRVTSAMTVRWSKPDDHSRGAG